MTGDDVASAPAPAPAPEANPVSAIQWRRAPRWVHRVFGDEVLLYGPEGNLVTVTGIASAVWLVLDRQGSVAQVVERVVRRWPARTVDCDAVSDAMDGLADAGVIDAPEAGIARLWGVTEDGEVAEVVVARHLVDELARRWPLIGLDRRIEPPEGTRRPAARLGLSDTGLFVPDEATQVGHDPDQSAWGLLEQSLTAIAVEHLTQLVAVHSAVIAWKGSVMLVPATSGAGKSTLTVAAAQAGATVLSDEYALVDPGTGLVTGWSRPVRVRRDDGTEDRVDLAVESEPLPVGLIASVTHEPGGPASWQPISASAAVFEILANTICAQTRPDDSLDAAMAITRTAHAVKGTRGEASDAIHDLLTLLEAGRRPAGSG